MVQAPCEVNIAAARRRYSDAMRFRGSSVTDSGASFEFEFGETRPFCRSRLLGMDRAGGGQKQVGVAKRRDSKIDTGRRRAQ